MRLLCGDARVDMQSVRHGSLRDDDWVKLSAALGPLAAANIYIDDTSGITPSQLRSRCRRLKMERGLDLIVVDYLQLMSSDTRAENRQNEVSEISRALKSIAKELNVPLVALAQLSRAGAQRSDKRPILSDLRDSGAIERPAGHGQARVARAVHALRQPAAGALSAGRGEESRRITQNDSRRITEKIRSKRGKPCTS